MGEGRLLSRLLATRQLLVLVALAALGSEAPNQADCASPDQRDTNDEVKWINPLEKWKRGEAQNVPSARVGREEYHVVEDDVEPSNDRPGCPPATYATHNGQPFCHLGVALCGSDAVRVLPAARITVKCDSKQRILQWVGYRLSRAGIQRVRVPSPEP